MHYVTKFLDNVGIIYGEMGINAATSTGAIDVIVIKQTDGSFLSTPFHVRFGKFKVLKPKDAIVDIFVNKKYIKEIKMRVEPTGEAYFDFQGSTSKLSEMNDLIISSDDENLQKCTEHLPTSDKNIIQSDEDPTKMTSNNNLDDYISALPQSLEDLVVQSEKLQKHRNNILPSEKLNILELSEGINQLEYSVTGKYRGTITVCCRIYLWKWSDRIVISDIDGTITKSDVRGQLAPLIGLDWTQSGIVKLFNDIEKNNFRFVYLSARAICQTEQTRKYLQSITQENMFLPDGPLLLTPSSLLSAFKKEVIEKIPQEFKIKCLEELKSLFPQKNPRALYAGFGNKSTDEVTYKALFIPENNIFIINKCGEINNKVITESAETSKLSYKSLDELVDRCFPIQDV